MPIGRIIQDAIPGMMEGFFAEMWKKVSEAIFGIFTWVLQQTLEPYKTMWNNPVIVLMVRLGEWAAHTVFIIALVFMLVDALEEMGSHKSVAVSDIFGNVMKGYLFCLAAPRIAIFALSFSAEVLSLLDFSSALNNFDIEAFLVSTLVMTVILVIACVVFVFMVAKQHAMMFIHIITYSCYVANIVRGDTQAMGAWLRQMIAIALTFFCQFVMFYMGVFFFMNGDHMLCLMAWMGMGNVTKVLNKFGMSSGFGGLASGASNMMRTGMSFIRMVK